MRTTSRTRHASLAMDVLRPSQAFGSPPASPTHDARRWLRLALVVLASASTVAALLGAA